MENREQKLVEYIQELLKILSLYSVFVQQIYKLTTWFGNSMNSFPYEFREKQVEILEYLKTEFQLDYKVIDEVNGEDGS